MAFTVTSRVNENTGTTSAGSHTSGSFTPAANSRLFVFAVSQRDQEGAPVARNWQISDSQSLTWTKLDESALTGWGNQSWADSYALNVVCWYADIGASPASMTVTVDASASNEWYVLLAFDVTGFDPDTPFAQASVDNAVGTFGGSGDDNLSLTLTLGSAPTSGNLVVAMFGAGADGAGGFAVPSGYTALVNQNQSYTQGAVFYRTDTTTAAVTCSDLGQAVGNAGGIIFEMTLASEGGGDIELTVADAAHAHGADAPALIQQHLLAAAEAGQVHTADNVALLQAYVLGVAAASHAHAADGVNLDVGLTPADASHAHGADNTALLQAYVLSAADAGHTHGVDNISLATLLVVADALHGHAADNTALLQAHVLSVADAGHTHGADNAALVQAYLLALADAGHGHAADGVNLGVGLTPADASHTHTADAPALIQQQQLVVAEASHAHAADGAALAQLFILALADALHSQAADSVTVALDTGFAGVGTRRAISPRLRSAISAVRRGTISASERTDTEADS